MQSMQNVIPFFPASSTPSPKPKPTEAVKPALMDRGFANVRSSENRLNGEATGGDVLEGDFFASLLVALTQIEKEENVDKNAAPFGLSDVTPSEKPEEGEKDRALSLENKADKVLFSKAVLDLLASLKNGPDAGEDADAFTKRVDEALDGALLDVDSKRLQAMLSNFRSRFSGQIDDPIGADGLNQESPVSLQAGDLPAYPHFKPELPRLPSKAEPNAVEADDTEEPPARIDANNAYVLPGAVAPEGKAPLVPEGESVSRAGGEVPVIPLRSAPNNTKESDRAPGDKNPGEAQKKSGVAEYRTNFEQFFEGVMSRRGQPEVRADALPLEKEHPLPQNEALREGLSNVVRFIRAGGEQRASVIVDPPALGRISVELTSGTAGLEASIKVGSEQIRQLIQDQIAQLRWSLAQQGVQLTHFSVDVQQDNDHRDRNQGAGQRRRGGASEKDDDAESPTVFRVDLNEGLLYWVA